jgi:hypothetical protein
MLALLETFFQIVMRRRGPEDLPDSSFLFTATLIAYMLAQVPVAAAFYGWSTTSLQAISMDTALLVGCFWLLLKATQRVARYRRTMTALLGTGTILALGQAPLVLLSKLTSAGGQVPMGPTLGLLALLIWSIIIQAHIASRALSSTFGVGLLVALVYFLVNLRVSGHFAPAAG